MKRDSKTSSKGLDMIRRGNSDYSWGGPRPPGPLLGEPRLDHFIGLSTHCMWTLKDSSRLEGASEQGFATKFCLGQTYLLVLRI